MSAPARPETDRLSLLTLVNVALRYRWFIAQVTAVMIVAVLAIVLIRPRTYTTTTTFRAQNRNSVSSSGGLAGLGLVAQLGGLSSLLEGSQSTGFYVDLLKSRQILGPTVSRRYPTARQPNDSAVSLVDFLKARGKTPAIRRDRAIEKLADRMTVVASPKTGVITVSVKMKDPVVSREVAAQLLAELNRFNLEIRQSQAGAERRFTERRLEEVRRDLRAAEDRLQAFLQRNRDYRNSPSLTFQQERLARDVSMQQALFTDLAQAYEQAKIEEVRDTPVLTIVDPPELRPRPDRLGLLKFGLLALLLGAVAGLGLALARVGMARNRDPGSPEFLEFCRLREEALDGLRLGRWRRKKPPKKQPA